MRTISVGKVPTGLAVDTATNRIYVGDDYTGNFVTIDGATDAVVGSVNACADWLMGPNAMTMNPATSRIYGGVPGNHTVAVVDGSSNSSLGSIPVLGDVWDGMAVNPLTNRIYAGAYQGVINVIDGATDERIATPVGVGETHGVAVNTIKNRVYVSGGGGTAVLDGETNTVLYRSTPRTAGVLLSIPTRAASTFPAATE